MNAQFHFDVSHLISERYQYNVSCTRQYSSRLIDNDFNTQLITVFLAPKQFKASYFSKFSLEVILYYLRKTHQLYLDKKLGEIQLELGKLTFKEGEEQYWLPMAMKLFVEFSNDLSSHIADEENNLFPYVDSLLKAKESRIVKFNIQQKIKLLNFLLEHDDKAEKSLRFIIELLEKKRECFYDQLALGVLISRLKHFDTDLQVHAKLEDEVLIPKAIELEIDVLHDIDVKID